MAGITSKDVFMRPVEGYCIVDAVAAIGQNADKFVVMVGDKEYPLTHCQIDFMNGGKVKLIADVPRPSAAKTK